jgi:hypothetical protein
MPGRLEALRKLDARRRTHAAQTLTPAQNARMEIDLATRARYQVADYKAPLRRALASLVETNAADRENIPVLRDLTLVEGHVNRWRQTYHERLYEPMRRLVVRVGARVGRQPHEVFQDLGLAATALHVVEEAEPVHRAELDDRVAGLDDAAAGLREKIAAERAGSGRPTRLAGLRRKLDKTVRQLRQAETHRRLYEDAQNNDGLAVLTEEDAAVMGELAGKKFEPGTTLKIKMPGGLTAARYQDLYAALQKVYTASELKEGTDLIVGGYEGLLKDRIAAGEVLEGEFMDYKKYSRFVSLQTKGHTLQSFHRLGSTTPARDAATLLFELAEDNAKALGSLRYRRELLRFMKAARRSGTMGGFVLEDTDGLAKDSDLSDGRARAILEAPGVRVAETLRNKDGSARKVRWKITYMDPDGDAEKQDMILRGFETTMSVGPVASVLMSATRMMGQLPTRYRATFAPANTIRDLGERLFNGANRQYVRADGSLLDGLEMVKNMGRIFLDPAFWSSYVKIKRGLPAEGRYAGFMEEFQKSPANYTIMSVISDSYAARDLTVRKRNFNLFRRVMSPDSRFGLGKIRRAFDYWNDLWSAAPLMLNYVSLRDLGVLDEDAAFGVVDLMNYYQKGNMDKFGSSIAMFYRPAVQGGINLLRSLSPANKDPRTKYRGALAFAGLTLAALPVIAMLRAGAGDDDESGVGRYDALPASVTSRSMVLFLPGDEGYIKLPLPFGPVAAAWSWANSASLYMTGQLTPMETAYNMFVGFARQVVPDTMPAYAPTEAPLAWTLQTTVPQVLRPFIDAAMNKNHFGGKINMGNSSPGVQEWEKGRMTTPPVWHRIAKLAADLGFDTLTPEDVRYFANYYFIGPTAAVITTLEGGALVPPTHARTRDVLGIGLTALGADMLYGAPPNSARTEYYDLSARLDKMLTEKRVRLTDPNNKPGDKIPFIRRQMTAAGFDRATVEFAVARERAQSEIDKREKTLRARHRDKMLSDSAWDLENVRREYRLLGEFKDGVYGDAVRAFRQGGGYEK